GPLNAWNIAAGTWNVTGGAFEGAGTSLGSYAFSYITNSWTNYSVAARIQFPAGGYGGGIGARLNPLTGEHYAAWIYPENSTGGSNVLKLIKFQSYTNFAYQGTPALPIQQVNLAQVGTNFHTLSLTVKSNQLAVSFDGVVLISATDTE